MSIELPLYQVDAFTDKVFGGNPAAVCPLDLWLPDDLLQKIALENNLSETAFFVREHDTFHLRWFTPTDEVKLCGHATLSAAFVIFEFIDPALEKITFTSLSGDLIVYRAENGIMMDFPVWTYEQASLPSGLSEALGAEPVEFYKANDWVAVYETIETVSNMKPDMAALSKIEDARGFIATAKGEGETDFVSRTFYPRIGVPEDPVTGSAHCVMTPLWAKKLGKTKLRARQISSRGGSLICELKDERVEITGQAVLYMQGQINV